MNDSRLYGPLMKAAVDRASFRNLRILSGSLYFFLQRNLTVPASFRSYVLLPITAGNRRRMLFVYFISETVFLYTIDIPRIRFFPEPDYFAFTFHWKFLPMCFCELNYSGPVLLQSKRRVLKETLKMTSGHSQSPDSRYEYSAQKSDWSSEEQSLFDNSVSQ